jgi:hypothetical protein
MTVPVPLHARQRPGQLALLENPDGGRLEEVDPQRAGDHTA